MNELTDIEQKLEEREVIFSNKDEQNEEQEGKVLPTSDKNIILNDIDSIQKSIQEISLKIEGDKISLRILKERLVKKKNEYNKLARKPIIKSKEQKLTELKEKLEKLKNHHIFDPHYGKKKEVLNPGEETKKIQKNTDKCKIELENLTNAINKNILINNELTNQIKENRQERLKISKKIEKSEEQNKLLQIDLERSQKWNSYIYNKIQFQELSKFKEKGKIIQYDFVDKRDELERKYHKIIEANIRREKEHKNELRKLRLKNAIFADAARERANKTEAKGEDDDNILDRIPILELLIEKWKHTIKIKKNMIDKYIKNSRDISSSFYKIIDFLGLEHLDSLPEIYSKNEEQMKSLQSYLSSSSTEMNNLIDKKYLLENQINLLLKNKKLEKDEQNNLVEEKKSKIQNLNIDIGNLIENINRKKKLFKEIEKPTLKFIKKMQQTYLADFVVSKNIVDEKTKINEKNIISFLGTVYCYCQLIRDFDENVKNMSQYMKTYETDYVNDNLNLLKKDIHLKLSKMNSNNCVNLDIHKSINKVVKQGIDYDNNIKRLANTIVDQINNSVDYSRNNISSMMTNNMSS